MVTREKEKKRDDWGAWIERVTLDTQNNGQDSDKLFSLWLLTFPSHREFYEMILPTSLLNI
jgi:hypothetical protein